MKITIQFWGSHPDAGNDDHLTGTDVADEATARRLLMAPSAAALNYRGNLTTEVAYFRIVADEDEDGTGGKVLDTIKHEAYYSKAAQRARHRQEMDDASLERNERAMQAGMGLGIDAFNEEMGY